MSISELSQSNKELSKSLIKLKAQLSKQQQQINDLRSEKRLLYRELTSKKLLTTYEIYNENDKVQKTETVPMTISNAKNNIRENRDNSINHQIDSNRTTIDRSELESVYRDKLDECEKLKEKYLQKHKDYKLRYPKTTFQNLNDENQKFNVEIQLLHEKYLNLENEKSQFEILLEESKANEENLNLIISELKNEIVEGKNREENLEKDKEDYEKMKLLLQDELNRVSTENFELMNENEMLKNGNKEKIEN